MAVVVLVVTFVIVLVNHHCTSDGCGGFGGCSGCGGGVRGYGGNGGADLFHGSDCS